LPEKEVNRPQHQTAHKAQTQLKPMARAIATTMKLNNKHCNTTHGGPLYLQLSFGNHHTSRLIRQMTPILSVFNIKDILSFFPQSSSSEFNYALHAFALKTMANIK
jgi:hypothetical protein